MLNNNHPVKVFATTGSDKIAQDVCAALTTRLPRELFAGDEITLGRAKVDKFSNGNLQVQVENVRGHFAVVIHTQTPPVNENLMELMALLDAIINANPADILLVFPYMPYSRSDRKNQPRISTMGCRLPKILSQGFGIKRVLLLDPHDSHIKHYFEPAADEITALYLLADHLESRLLANNPPREKWTIVFADAGAAKRFKSLAYLLKLPTAYIDKDRPDNAEHPAIKEVVGETAGQNCVLVDDEILTGKTVLEDAEKLFRAGARTVFMTATHPILEDNKSSAVVTQKLEDSRLTGLVVTDSVPVREKIVSRESKFTVLTVAPLLAEAISRIVRNQSLTELHEYAQVPRYRP